MRYSLYATQTIQSDIRHGSRSAQHALTNPTRHLRSQHCSSTQKLFSPQCNAVHIPGQHVNSLGIRTTRGSSWGSGTQWNLLRSRAVWTNEIRAQSTKVLITLTTCTKKVQNACSKLKSHSGHSVRAKSTPPMKQQCDAHGVKQADPSTTGRGLKTSREKSTRGVGPCSHRAAADLCRSGVPCVPHPTGGAASSIRSSSI